MAGLAAQSTDAFVAVADAMTDQPVAGGVGAGGALTAVSSGMPTERSVGSEPRRATVGDVWGVGRHDARSGGCQRCVRAGGCQDVLVAVHALMAATRFRGSASPSGMRRIHEET